MRILKLAKFVRQVALWISSQRALGSVSSFTLLGFESAVPNLPIDWQVAAGLRNPILWHRGLQDWPSSRDSHPFHPLLCLCLL